MNICFAIIPHEEQRYNTIGDWWINADGLLDVRVSKMSDWRFAMLTGLHELCEVWLEVTKRGGWSFLHQLSADVDDFDKKFEQWAGIRESDEPGCSPRAPYFEGHMLANAIEHVAAMVLRVNYNDYAREVERLIAKRRADRGD